MPARRLPHPARHAQPQSSETASAAADRILRRKLDPHRIASYGEVREYHTHRRWWARRWMLAFALIVLTYPINYSFYAALTKHRVLPATTTGAQVMSVASAPLVSVRRASRDLDWYLGFLDSACDATVQLSLGKATVVELVPWWTLYALPLLFLAGYSLSPGPVWWGFRLCAIEFMAAVYAVMEVLYAPLVWLVDRSKTARGFYEGYYDAMEWID